MSEDNNELKASQEQQPVEYTDDNIRHLSDMEHVRTRPVCTLVVWVMVTCRRMESTYLERGGR